MRQTICTIWKLYQKKYNNGCFEKLHSSSHLNQWRKHSFFHAHQPSTNKVPLNHVRAENGIAPRFWRLDSQCGEGVMNPSYPGGPEWATCDPEGVYPCCSDAGWCGITPNHCTCNGCIDYRHIPYLG